MAKKSQKQNQQKEPRQLAEINGDYNQALKELGLMQYQVAAYKIQIELKNKRISEIVDEGNLRANLDKLKAEKNPSKPPEVTPKAISDQVSAETPA